MKTDNNKLQYITTKAARIAKTPSFLCFAGGLSLSLPYFNGYLFAFAFMGLTCLFMALQTISHLTLPKHFRHCFIFAISFFLPLYSFFYQLYPLEGFNFSETMKIAVVILAAIGIPIIHSLIFSVFMMLGKLFDNIYIKAFMYVALYMTFEWFISLGELGFSWGRLAVSQYLILPMIESVSLFGSCFITALMVFVCYMAAAFIKNKKKNYLYIAAAVLTANLLIGGVMLTQPPDNNGVSNNIAIIQGNVLFSEKWDKKNSAAITEKYLKMTRHAAENGAKTIFLPESAFPEAINTSGKIAQSISEIATKYNCYIMLGAVISDQGQNFNSIICANPDGSFSERYDKVHIVPFGEFMPYQDILAAFLPFLSEMDLGKTNVVAGDTYKIINAGGINYSPLVCYDSIYADIPRNASAHRAQAIAVLTNDSWYRKSSALEQHVAHSVLRAIENNRYVVRAANTGISCVIDEKGRILTETEKEVSDILYANIYANDGRTLYSYIGDAVLYAGFVYIGVMLFILMIIKLKGNKNA